MCIPLDIMELHMLLLLLLLLLCSVLFIQQPSMALQLRGEEDQDHHLFGRPHDMIVNPPTGYCVLRKRSHSDPLKLGPCAMADPWTHTPQNFLLIKGTYFCLQAVGAGKPVRLSILCSPSDSQWKSVFGAPKEEEENSGDSEKTRLVTKLANGETLCLEVDPDDGTLISNPCRSQRGSGAGEFDSQWFTIVSTRAVES